MKREITCPHCGKRKVTVVSSNGVYEELKGGSWYPLAKQVSPLEWTEGWTNGISAECKCGHVFFVYGIEDEAAPLRVATKPDSGTLFVGFCEKCGSAFIAPEAVCPWCKTQF